MTAEAKAKICKAVRLGIWPDRAAEMHGIRAGTMRKERKRDPEFATALKEAEAHAESAIYGKILRHMDGQWTACAWMLERRWPERWARRDPVTEAGKDEGRRLMQTLQAMRAASHQPAEPDEQQT